jgi:DNA polymerase III epsilon subunit-like protein
MENQGLMNENEKTLNNGTRNIMVIDTEYENTPRRLISLAYVLVSNNEITGTKSFLIKHNPNIFQIDQGGMAFSKHGITNKMCMDTGYDIKYVLNTLLNDLNNSDIIVGHNIISADISTIRREAIGINMWSEIFNCLKQKQINDTLKCFKEINKELPSYSLDKIYKHLFHKEFENHHDALEDCQATLKIFNYIQNFENYNLKHSGMNFVEDEIENVKNNNYYCYLCKKTISNYYSIQKLHFLDKYEKYNFKLYSFYDIKNNDILCNKCYENIEILKLDNGEMVDILNKSMNKNTFKYKEYLEAKEICFEYIENVTTKETIKKETIPKENRKYLNCPFEEKEECKKNGARWDIKEKKWYINKNSDFKPFEKWL